MIHDLVNDPKFQPPSRTGESFHVKEQFYRPPQFLAKGLAWHYGVDAVSPMDQWNELRRRNLMSLVSRNNFKAVMDVMARLRFRLHLDREGEKDFVLTNQGARDRELQRLEAISPHSRTADQKERLNRLKAGTFLTRAELSGLTGCISNLNYIMRKAREFAAQKEKGSVSARILSPNSDYRNASLQVLLLPIVLF